MTNELETRLREGLQRSARSMPDNPDPLGSVRAGLSRRRRKGKGTAGLVLVAAAALVSAIVILPQYVQLGGDTGPSGDGSGEVGRVGTSKADKNDLRRHWPVRGSLADDKAYLKKAEQWIAGSHNGKTAKILYAGDIGKQRVVVGIPDTDPTPAVLTGPGGTDDELTQFPGSSMSVPKGLAIAELDNDRILTLAATNVERVEFSSGPRIETDGRITRRWIPLEGERLEPGVEVTAQAKDAARPGFRAYVGDRIADDVRLESMDPIESPADPELRKLVDRTPGAKEVPGIASALSGVQHSILGPDRIVQLAVTGRITGDTRGAWTRLDVGTSDGGAVELVLWEPKKQQKAEVYLARAVPADRLGSTPMAWLDGCRTYGMLPESMSQAERAEFAANGKPAGSASIKGRMYTKALCGHQDPPASWEKTKVTAELFSADGERLWKGTPVKFSESYIYSLDVPRGR